MVSGTKKDPLRIRILVPFVWFFDQIDPIAFLCAYLYRVTITYNGNVAIAEKTHWTLDMTALFDGLVGGLVQSFFAHRIFVLSKRWPIPIISWAGSFLAFTGTVAMTSVATVTDMARYLAGFGWLVTTVSALLLSVDIINTAALCTYLRVGKTGYQSTDCMLNKLFIWTLVYSNSLMASLNAREILRNMATEDDLIASMGQQASRPALSPVSTGR
ncbi:hypothetical protein HWV62_33041 [Athelia sp. TMB]|nr:hypothetical protein HWV62_33041 [Athelia sp. TMB]